MPHPFALIAEALRAAADAALGLCRPDPVAVRVPCREVPPRGHRPRG